MGRVLVRLAEGTTTVGALAAELGVDRPRVAGMLETLSRLGYLERLECGAGEAPSGQCHGCARAGGCGRVAAEGDGGAAPVYALTEKGRRVGGKSMSHEGHSGPAGGKGPGPWTGDAP